MARVLAHAHSIWSHDGTLSLTEWADLGEQIGCNAILLTEHEETGWTPERYSEYATACRAASSAKVQLIPGIEFRQDGFHVLCYGLQSYPFRPSPITQLAAEVSAQNCLLCLAHPGKYAWRHPVSLVAHMQAVEVWNSKWIYDGTLGPHPSSLKMGRGKLLLAGQDVHKPKHFSSLFIETRTSDFLSDIMAGRYWIVLGDRRWAPEQLRQRPIMGLAQRCRTQVMKTALAIYRAKLKRYIKRARENPATMR